MKVRVPFCVRHVRGRWTFCCLRLQPPYVLPRNRRHLWYFSMDLTEHLFAGWRAFQAWQARKHEAAVLT